MWLPALSCISNTVNGSFGLARWESVVMLMQTGLTHHWTDCWAYPSAVAFSDFHFGRKFVTVMLTPCGACVMDDWVVYTCYLSYLLHYGITTKVHHIQIHSPRGIKHSTNTYYVMYSKVAFTPLVMFIWSNRKNIYTWLPFSSGPVCVHTAFLQTESSKHEDIWHMTGN